MQNETITFAGVINVSWSLGYLSERLYYLHWTDLQEILEHPYDYADSTAGNEIFTWLPIASELLFASLVGHKILLTVSM